MSELTLCICRHCRANVRGCCRSNVTVDHTPPTPFSALLQAPVYRGTITKAGPTAISFDSQTEDSYLDIQDGKFLANGDHLLPIPSALYDRVGQNLPPHYNGQYYTAQVGRQITGIAINKRIWAEAGIAEPPEDWSR